MSQAVKRVFAQRWADMSDDDSLGELPSSANAAIKAQLAASQPLHAPPTSVNADATTCTPPTHEKASMPPPAPVKPTAATLAATTTPLALPASTAAAVSSSLDKSSKLSAASTTAAIVFQSKPKPGFKSWTDLARPVSTTSSIPATLASASASAFITAAADPVRRVLSFEDSDDDNSRMDVLPLPPVAAAGSAAVVPAAAAAASAAYDPELDNSRDGLPLLMRQATVCSGLGRLAEDDSDGMDASMESSRDRGIKRKQAEAEAPTPRNSPVKEAALQPKQQLVTAWAAGKAAAALFDKTRSVAATAQPNEAAAVVAVVAKEEGVTKKQKVSDSQAVPTKAATPRIAAACPAPLPVSIIRPVSVNGRVTRSAWKRINDAAAPAPPPSPALSAINSLPPVQRKQRLVVVKKKDLPTLTSSTAPSLATTPAPTSTIPAASSSTSTAAASSPDSPTPSTASTPSAAPPSPRTLARRLEQRQKQIVLGKRTVGYQRYRGMVHKRDRVDGQHPRTPNAKRQCSKRSWDGQVRKWRRELHRWDEGKNGERDETEEGEDEEGGEVEAGEVSELGSEWSMRNESEVSEMGSELDSELSSKRGEEAAELQSQQDVAVV